MDHNTKWTTYTTALRDYAATNGHAAVPAGYTHRPADDGTSIPLGAWVGYIRQRYRRGLLPADRIETLESIPGWVWGPLKPGPRIDQTRNAEILRLRTEERLSLQKIADRYGLSRQRIHQIVKQEIPGTDDHAV